MKKLIEKPLESAIQSKLINKFENDGYYVIKIIQSNCNGIGDTLLLHRDREKIHFIEVKRTGKKASPLQRMRAKEIFDKTGIETKIIDHV